MSGLLERSTCLMELPRHVLIMLVSKVSSPDDLHSLACTSLAMSQLCALPDLMAAWLMNRTCSKQQHPECSPRCGSCMGRHVRALRAWECSPSVARQILTRSKHSGADRGRMGPWTSCSTASQALAQWLLLWAVRTPSSGGGGRGVGDDPKCREQPLSLRSEVIDWALCLSNASSQAEAIRRFGQSYANAAFAALEAALSFGAVWAVKELLRPAICAAQTPLPHQIGITQALLPHQAQAALQLALGNGHDAIASVLLRHLTQAGGTLRIRVGCPEALLAAAVKGGSRCDPSTQAYQKMEPDRSFVTNRHFLLILFSLRLTRLNSTLLLRLTCLSLLSSHTCHPSGELWSSC